MAIGLYQRGPVSLPHPPYPFETLRLVERAIAEAWRVIRDHPEPGFDLANADEDAITAELRVCLINTVLDGPAVPGFDSKTFRINRDSKFESFDRARKDLMPDFHIAVVRDDVSILDAAKMLKSEDGLFIECKPIDRDHPAGADYCDRGIARFVRGDYAWAMAEGMMVGYAADGYSVPEKLSDAIASRRATLKSNGEVSSCTKCSAEGYAQHPHVTVHRRGFACLQTGTKAPPIRLRHLWLNRG
jgi:hypothetical protein